LTKAEVFSVIEQAAGIGCTEVCFTGGEPLLREDLDEFVRHAGKLSLVTKINTNGILLNRERVLQLKKAGLTWCSVSIDSPDPQIHDKLRRFNGCYEKAIEGLKELYAQGISTSITTYVKKKNLHRGELERIVKLGHELNVDTVRILFPVPMGGFKNDQSVVLNFEEREYVRRLLKDPIVTLESPFEKSRCKAAVTKMNILPDGDVTPCVFVPRAYGNVREDSLKETWKRMKEFDSLCKPNGKCPMCNEKFRNLLLNELSKPKK
jgi:MoaA/NifB/PqqE/SkfB family radical SAM enzyme